MFLHHKSQLNPPETANQVIKIYGKFQVFDILQIKSNIVVDDNVHRI